MGVYVLVEALLNEMRGDAYSFDDYSTVESALSNIATVDAVEVVRCAECKWYERCQCYHPRHECHAQSIFQEPEDYCSYGERKEDNAN